MGPTKIRQALARLCLAAILGLAALAAPAAAVPMTWLIEGRGSGEIGGASFTDAAFRFTLKGRTENLRADRWTEVVDPLDSARIFIAGHGTAKLRIPTRLGVAQSLVGDAPVVFLSRSGSMLDLFDFSVARPFGLGGPFSAILGGEVFGLDQFQGVATSRGALSFARADRVRISAAPLSAAAWLLLAGAGAIAALGAQPKTRPKIVSTCLV